MSTITVDHKQKQGIDIKFVNGELRGWTFDGKKLTCRGKTLVLSPEKTKELEQAIKNCKPAKYETKKGYEMTADDKQYDWDFIGVVGDAHGAYERLVAPSVRPTVEFGQADVVSFG